MTQPPADLICSRGHRSHESDYCSICGAPMPGTVPSTPVDARPCPSCGTPRAGAGARYCEVCRYDYQALAPGPPPVVVGSEPLPAPTGRADWEVTIVLDRSLDTEPDPAVVPPPDIGERIFPVDLPEMLVGRRDDVHHIRPEIPVIDPGVSRRHAHLLRLPGGRLAIVDLASANGTAVNGAGLIAGQRRELADGDVVTLGRWTRITVRRRGREYR